MKLISRRSIWRLLAGLVIAVTALYAGGCYMCRCGGRVTTEVPAVEIAAENLQTHVEMLAGTIGPRSVFRPAALQAAASYIEQTWQVQGHSVARQTYEVNRQLCANLEVTIAGTDRPAEIIVVGAHYDSVDDSPGANDNASGVAALLELSRGFRPLPRTVKFVAFVNEEPPWFETERMGSRVYAKACRARGDDVRAMIALETMGYFSNAPGSQHFPSKVFNLFYPDRGNFIGFISNFKSRSLLHRAVRAFRQRTTFPAACCATFPQIAGVGWSDHASFWKEGYRAFMVTDTAPFRYPHYHAPTDTPDKLDYDSMARVTDGVAAVITALASE